MCKKKTSIVTKLKNSNCDKNKKKSSCKKKTQTAVKLQILKYAKTQNGRKLHN